MYETSTLHSLSYFVAVFLLMPVGGMCVAKFVSRTQVYETLLVSISPGKHRLCQGGLTGIYETSVLHSLSFVSGWFH